MSRRALSSFRGRPAIAAMTLLAALAAVAGPIARSGAAVPAAAVPAAMGLAATGLAATGLAPDVLPVGGAVRAVGIDENSGLVWAAATSGGKSDTVTGFSEASQTTTATLTVPAGADSLAVDQQTGLVWVASGGTGKEPSQVLTMITESSGTSAPVDLTSASAGGHLIGVVADASSAKVFVLVSNGRLIEVPETAPAQFKVISAATVTNPGALAVDPADGRIWITSLAGNSVSAFTESGSPAGGLPGAVAVGSGPGSIAIDPDSGLVWVGNLLAGTLTEIRASTGAVIASAIKVGQGLAVVAVAPDQAHPDKGLVWTAGSFLPFTFDELSEASASQPAQLTASGPADPAGVPEAIAVDPSNGQLYEGTSEGLSPFLPVAPALMAQALTFWMHVPSQESDTATGVNYFPPPVFTLSGAPSWMRINRFTGVFHGQAPRPGTFSFTVTARNTLGNQSTAQTTITVDVPPVFTSPTSTMFVAGRKSRFQITATAVPKPTFTLSETALPAGLAFTSSGLLSGVPAAGTEGSYIFFVDANNDPDGPINSVQTLTLHVVRGHAPRFSSPAKQRIKLRAGHHATVTIRVTGTPVPRLSIKGKLPRGLAAGKQRQGTVLISGVPAHSAAGHSFKLSVVASNVIGHIAETLVISIG